ncbi:MAG: metallophosphoesterase [Fuerstia sp.]|nr:metallophosphoesterase [Fuerstiella sp.]
MKLCLITILCLALVTMAQPSLAGDAPATTGTVLWISDIHFNPFYGRDVLKLATSDQKGWRDHTEWPAILANMPANQSCSGKEDTNDFLLRMVVDHADTVTHASRPDFILITGDFLSHDFTSFYFNQSGLPVSLAQVPQHNDFVSQTMAYIAMTISTKFDGIPVIAALGNNDAFCGDYDVRRDSGFLASTQKTFQKYFLSDLSDDFRTVGGCYSTKIPGTQHRVIVLNSIPFMKKYPDLQYVRSSSIMEDACLSFSKIDLVDEFQWFRKIADNLGDSEKVWIACHVPPGIDCFQGTQYWDVELADASRDSSFLEEFIGYYNSRGQHMAGILAGHSHMAEFKLINNKNVPASSVLMAPSISRIHANNASFRVMTFDRESLIVADYVTHWLDASMNPASPSWGAPFKFTESYMQPDVSPRSLAAVYQQMTTSPVVLNRYFEDYSTRNGSRNSSARQNFKLAIPSVLGP